MHFNTLFIVLAGSKNKAYQLLFLLFSVFVNIKISEVFVVVTIDIFVAVTIQVFMVVILDIFPENRALIIIE